MCLIHLEFGEFRTQNSSWVALVNFKISYFSSCLDSTICNQSGHLCIHMEVNVMNLHFFSPDNMVGWHTSKKRLIKEVYLTSHFWVACQPTNNDLTFSQAHMIIFKVHHCVMLRIVCRFIHMPLRVFPKKRWFDDVLFTGNRLGSSEAIGNISYNLHSYAFVMVLRDKGCNRVKEELHGRPKVTIAGLFFYYSLNINRICTLRSKSLFGHIQICSRGCNLSICLFKII